MKWEFEVPHSLEAEQSVLGSILFDETVIDEVIGFLRTEDFYNSSHQIIYQAMLDLYAAKKPIDLVEVITKLKDRKQLDEVGGSHYIASMKDSIPTTENAKHHAEIIVEKAIRRKAILASRKITEIAILGDFNNTQEFIDSIEREVLSIRPAQRNGLTRVTDGLTELINNAYADENESVEVIRTGFHKLDEFTGGLQRGNLIVLAARPSVGKTAMSLAISMAVANQDSGPVLYFALEMDKRQLKRRMLSSITGIPLKKIIRRKISPMEFERLVEVSNRFDTMNMLIDDTPHVSIEYVMAEARKIKREFGKIGLIVIDYLGLMNLNEQKGETRAAAIGRVTRRSKQLARELDCPLLMLAQMNREIEKRGDKRPKMSDLRESGDIEADADIIAFLHHDEERTEIDNSGNVIKFVEMIIEKGRDIGTADFGFRFMVHIQRFEEVGKKNG